MPTSLNLNFSIVSPKNILSWSSRNILNILYVGEVYCINTINYINGIPLNGGLFCEKIFGPIKSWRCNCSTITQTYKYICPTCGCEINTNNVRRFRMGIILFQTPMFHTWYCDSTSSILPILLNCSYKVLYNLIYYVYCKNNKHNYPLNVYGILKKLYLKQLIYINLFIQNYFTDYNIINNIVITKEQILTLFNISHINLMYKKLFFLNVFFFNKLSISWVLLDNFPIIPPDLRPIIKIDDNHFIISKINNIYKNILLYNNKLKIFINLKCTVPIIFEINEKIKLQKTIDKFLNKSNNYKNSNLIIKTLSGKYGIFRQNLLGKRIDYSGRSVIVSGPDLNFSKVGIPVSIACNLFTPFIINIMKKYKTIKFILNNLNLHTSILYRRLITRIFKTNIILLNRAPTLHRVNIQGFKPYLIEGQSIRLYPIVCSSFNADFDGDQMSVILTMTKSSRLESKYIMSSDKNFLSSATGTNLFKLNQIMLIGLFFINTLYYKKNNLYNIYLSGIEDVLNYYTINLIEPYANVWIRLKYINIYSNCVKNYFIFTNISRFILTKLIYI